MSAILLAVTLAFAGAADRRGSGSWRAARLRPADATAEVGAVKPVPGLPPRNPYYRPSGEGTIPHHTGARRGIDRESRSDAVVPLAVPVVGS